MVPGGMRIGTPALTTRGFKEAEFVQVADFIDRAVKITADCRDKTPAPGGWLKLFALNNARWFRGCDMRHVASVVCGTAVVEAASQEMACPTVA